MKTGIYILSFCILMVFCTCKKPYLPPATSTTNSYLVVEGVIDPGSDSTIIKLSHTVNLDSTTTRAAEIGATVNVEGDNNGVYPLYGPGDGTYLWPGLNLPVGPKYRLRIITAAGKEYVSDFVEVKNSPPIDTVTYKIEANQLDVNVSTHDPTNKTRYYRWAYNETYEYHSTFPSLWKSNGDTVLLRDQANDEIYTCWRGGVSSTVLLGSSAGLASDVINQNPLAYFSSTSEKIFIDYSMLLKQYALTQDAYNFWQNLKKNTEQLGGIFDPQPSQVKSNIHSVNNPLEPVIGYLSVGSVTSKRVFINKDALPLYWQLIKNECLEIPYFFTVVDAFGRVTHPEDQYLNYNKGAPVGAYIPTRAIISGTTVVGHYASDPSCVDCTLRGTNVMPSYWK